jgi:hypothetical protein
MFTASLPDETRIPVAIVNRIRLLSLATLLTLTPACATAPGAASDANDQFERTPADVAAIRTFWMGARPPCPYQQVREVQATSENGLRWAAWNVRAQAVVGVRSRQLDAAPGTPNPVSRVYEGIAVRYNPGCPALNDSARAPASDSSRAPAPR